MDANCIQCKSYNKCLYNALNERSPMRCANYNRIIEGIDYAAKTAKEVGFDKVYKGQKSKQMLYFFLCDPKQDKKDAETRGVPIE